MLLSLVSLFLYSYQRYFHNRNIGYGQTGPYRQAAGYDVVIEGEAGLMHM